MSTCPRVRPCSSVLVPVVEFQRSVAALTEVAGRKAIIPTITGSAYLTGFNQLVVDGYDPLGEGFYIPAAGGG